MCCTSFSIHPQSLFEGKEQPWRLGKFFGDPKFAVGESGDGFMRELEGCVVQPAQKADRFVTKELMNNLFNSKKVSQLNKVNLQGEILTGFLIESPAVHSSSGRGCVKGKSFFKQTE